MNETTTDMQATRDSGESASPQPHPCGGARPSRHAPPASPRGMMKNLEAPLRELFWSRPDTERVAEARQRLADFLSAALAQEQIQLFDDLYELPF